MTLVDSQITTAELKQMANNMFGELVKAVVDIEKEVMVVDAQMHADEEEVLLKQGSDQANLWGINLYPDKINNKDWIEFESMINLRPGWGNRSRGVDDPDIRQKIISIVNKLVIKC